MYLYLEREGREEGHYVDGEGGDPLAAVLHQAALAGGGVGRGEGRGAERSEIKI